VLHIYINSYAALATKRTGEQNAIGLNPVITNLADCFLSRLTGSVDVILCNPPYVVTPHSEVGSKGIEASWAGGEKGREVMDRLFPVIPQLLSGNGAFYLVIIKENNQDEIADILSRYKLQMCVILSRRSGPEHLSVLKFTRVKH